MTQEEFAKKRWQHSEAIEYSHPRSSRIVECMLLAIDFENGLLKLEPFDKEIYEDKSFWARVENCKRPAPKLKVSKS